MLVLIVGSKTWDFYRKYWDIKKLFLVLNIELEKLAFSSAC